MTNNNQQTNVSNYVAIAALIFAFLLPLLGIILAIIALLMNRKTKNSNVLAIIALVLGGIGTIISIVFLAFVFWGTSTDGGKTFIQSVEQYGASTRADIQHNALKQYYIKNGFYPADVSLTTVNEKSLIPPKGYVFRYNPTPTGCEQCTGYTLEVLDSNQNPVYVISDVSPIVEISEKLQ